jgi:hypothetical protein
MASSGIQCSDNKSRRCSISKVEVATLNFKEPIPLFSDDITVFVSSQPKLDILMFHPSQEDVLFLPANIVKRIVRKDHCRLIRVTLLENFGKKVRTNDKVRFMLCVIYERTV